MSNKNLRDELDKIALEIAAAITHDEVQLDLKLDAFKVLSAYHLGLMKKGDNQQPDTGRPSFMDLKGRINKAV